MIPQRCVNCRKIRKRQLDRQYQHREGAERYHNKPSKNYSAGLRITEMRLAIETAIPLLNMAMLKPHRSEELIAESLMHLENARLSEGSENDRTGEMGTD